MKDKKMIIDLQEIIEDEVYRKLMDMHWEKLEDFKSQMVAKIASDSRLVAKHVANELMETIKKQRKDKL